MANFYLDKNGTSELGQSTSAVRVNGTDGTQDRILLLANAANVVVGPAVEIVDFAGSVGDYTFVTSADGGIAVHRGDTLVATVGLNPETSELRFAEGGLTVEQDPETGAITVGGQTVTGTKAEYTGDGMLTGQEHQSQAGGLGPAGHGQDYFLPKDFQPGNVIQSDGLSNTYTTEMNGLLANSQIVDASVDDEDVLVLNYNTRNLNGQIVNVETIQAKWDGLTDGEFDAKNVTSAAQGGTEIVVSNLRSVARNFVVNDVKANSVTVGEGLSGKLVVKGIKGGGAIDMGDSGVELFMAGAGATTVKAEADQKVTLNDGATPANAFTIAKAKPLTLSSDSDVTFTVDGLAAGTTAYINAAGKGQIVLNALALNGNPLAAPGGKDDLTHLTGFKAIRVTSEAESTSPKIAGYTVAAGQTLIFSDKDDAATTKFGTDKQYGVTLNLVAGEESLGKLDIADGHTDATKNQISRLELNTSGFEKVTIADIVTDGGKGLTAEPGADVVALTGSADVTLTKVSDGGIIDASRLEGKLTIGSDPSNGGTAVEVKDANHALAVATGAGGSEAFIEKVGAGLLFYAGGAGADKITFTDEISGKNDINTAGATVDLGAGDDVVVFDGMSFNNSHMLLDFGAGSDTLQVKNAKTGESNVKFEGKLSGFEVLEIADKLTFEVDASSLDKAPAFELRSSGLIINGAVDLSNVTAQNASVRPAVQVNLDGSKKAAATVLNGALAETIVITGGMPAKASDIVTVRNFVAGGVDQLRFDDDNTTVPSAVRTNVAVVDNVSGGIYTDAYLPGKNTLQARLDELAGKLDAAGKYAFYTDGTDTYVLACGAVTDGTPLVNVVRLEGASYTSSMLFTSLGFTTDKAPDPTGTTFSYKADGPHLNGTDNEDIFYIDKDVSEAVTVKGFNGDDTLAIISNVASAGSVTAKMGDGDDAATVYSTIEGALSLDMGSGADTVTLGGIYDTAATITLDGGTSKDENGDEHEDTLKGAGAALSEVTDVSITGFEVVDATNGLMVKDGAFVDASGDTTYDFTVKGTGLTIVYGSAALDVSAMKGEGAATSGVTVDASDQSTATTITLSAGVSGAATDVSIAEVVTIGTVDFTSDIANVTKITNFDTGADKIDISALNLSDVKFGKDTGTSTSDLTWSQTIVDLETALKSATDVKDGSGATKIAVGSNVAMLVASQASTFVIFGTIDGTDAGKISSFAYVVELVGVTGVVNSLDGLNGILTTESEVS